MSLTKVSYSMINGEYINVLDFGADPTGGTDSTSAFQLALAQNKAIFVPFGTYRIDSPIATDASPAYNFYMMGATEAHAGFSGNNQVTIDLSNNTQYFVCMGYDSTLKNITFKNGVDVLHHTSSGTDGNTTKLIDVFATQWSGTFFKGVGAGNGSHLSWVRPVLVSTNTSCVVFDSYSMGGDGFDNLYLTDGWIETASTIGFKINSGRFSVSATRFIPYTSANSIWFQVYGDTHMYLMDTDFGGESSRRIIYWGYAGGDIDIKNCGLFGTTGTSYAITLAAPPRTITLDNITSSSNPGKILYFDQNMSSANLALLAKTQFKLGNLSQDLTGNLVNVDSLQGTATVTQAFIDSEPAYLQVSDLVGNGGYPYVTSSYGPNLSTVNGTTNIFGGGQLGQQFTSNAADAYGYQYFNTGPGIASLPDGYLTAEAVIECNGGFWFRFNFGSATKAFYVPPGTHRVCCPTFFISTTPRQLGFDMIIPNVFTAQISELKVFKGNYTSRNLAVFGSAAPTNTTYLWDKGNRVINNNPTVGQPKSWVCTVGGAPGTWVSEGNL